VDDCHFSYITKLKKIYTHTHTPHLWWWLLLLLLLVGFKKFEKHSISKTYLYWIHYCISSWETMPLAFDIWEKMKKEEARFRTHTKYEHFCMVFFLCVCVCKYFLLFLLLHFSPFLDLFFFSIVLLFLFQCFFNEIN